MLASCQRQQSASPIVADAEELENAAAKAMLQGVWQEELTEDAKLLFITPGMPNAKLMNRYASRMVQLLDKMLDTSIQTGRSNRLIELLVEVVYGWQKTQNVTLTAKVERPVESMEDNKLIDVINIGADDE